MLSLNWDLIKIRFYFFIARLLPKTLIYFIGLHIWQYTTTGQYSDTEVPGVTIDEALRRWGNDFNI